MTKKIEKKECKNPVKIFTLDTETRGLYGEIFRVGLFDGKKHHLKNSFKELIPILLNYSTKYDIHIFIHNLDFDIAKMAKQVIPNADLKNSIFINNNVTVFKTNLLKQIKATNQLDQISDGCAFEKYPITFHDSLKLLPSTLDRLCKSFKVEQDKAKIDLKDHIINIGWGRDKNNKPIKKEKDYDKFNSEGYYFEHVDPHEKQLNKYLMNDNASLYEIINIIIKLSGLPIEEFLKCPTTASLAMKVYEYNYPDDYQSATEGFKHYRNKWDEMKESFVRDAYYGGRTEVFKPILENMGYHYDVNSLYPFVMKNNTFPVGYSEIYRGKKAKDIFTYWLNTKKGGGFLEIDIHVPENLHIPLLPKKYEGKLIFPVGKLRGIWTYEEIEKALDLGCKIEKVHQGIHYPKRLPIFKDFISYFEDIKINSTGAKREFSKLMQNSLYGKFGMRRIRKTLLPISFKEKCLEKNYRFIEYENPLFPGEFIEAEIPSKAKYIQPHIAAYVTSLARIHLYNGLSSQHEKGEVYYCDTDSIVCENEMHEKEIDSNEYGKWDLEAELLEGLFIQPKVYYEKYKDGKENIKFKGIPKQQMNKISKGTFYEIIERYKHIQRKIEKGEKINKNEIYFPIIKKSDNVKRRTKFATTFKNGHVDFDLAQEVSKGIILTATQKRKIDFIRNKTCPLEIKEY